MTETSDRLQAALADRYRIERELGQGGMATVYLAEDLKHHRKVAVKVLRPELAATLGPERFTREIEVAARLQHPHILGLLDSGDADGFFYYVMPYVEGETLRDRLARGGELPVPEAVRLLGEIAEALATAHRAGVVHRDIKPENVLLSGRHAMVMDFGVAKAVTEASRPAQLTSAGVALGTPAYMAPGAGVGRPAHGRAGGHLRPRRDGVRDAHRRHAVSRTQRAADARGARDPRAGAGRAAARGPLARARGGGDALPGQAAGRPVPDRRRAGGRARAAGHAERRDHADADAAGVGARGEAAGQDSAGQYAAGAAARARRRRRSSCGSRGRAPAARPLDANLVAVLPFRTAGADPSVQYLRQGMVDLMQAKLTGEGGPRAADARSVLAAVRDAGGSDDAGPHRRRGRRRGDGSSAPAGCCRAASWARRIIWS